MTETLLALHEVLLRYSVLIHHIKLNQLTWSGYEDGVRRRQPTYERELTILQTGRMNSYMCAQLIWMNHYNLALSSDIINDIQRIPYSPPTSFIEGDINAYIVFNNFQVDFMMFSDMFYKILHAI